MTYHRLTKAQIASRNQKNQREIAAAEERDRKDRQIRGVPECLNGKGGRYQVYCYHIGDHVSLKDKWYRIGYKLTKVQAVECADACSLPAVVSLINQEYHRDTYRNAEAERIYERRST